MSKAGINPSKTMKQNEFSFKAILSKAVINKVIRDSSISTPIEEIKEEMPKNTPQKPNLSINISEVLESSKTIEQPSISKQNLDPKFHTAPQWNQLFRKDSREYKNKEILEKKKALLERYTFTKSRKQSNYNKKLQIESMIIMSYIDIDSKHPNKNAGRSNIFVIPKHLNSHKMPKFESVSVIK